MAYKVKKSCRICGKEYVPCADCENDNVAFHWRTVACSRECGMEYFRRVLEARGEASKEETPVVEEPIEETIEEVVDETPIEVETLDVEVAPVDESVVEPVETKSTRRKGILKR